MADSEVIAAGLEEAATLGTAVLLRARDGVAGRAAVELDGESAALRAVLRLRIDERPAVLAGSGLGFGHRGGPKCDDYGMRR